MVLVPILVTCVEVCNTGPETTDGACMLYNTGNFRSFALHSTSPFICIRE